MNPPFEKAIADVRAYGLKSLTDDQKLCVFVMAVLQGGEHHCHNLKAHGTGMECVHYGDASTWDFDLLTRMVLLSHGWGVRLSLTGTSKARELKLIAHRRVLSAKDDSEPLSMSVRHPSLQELLARIEKMMPQTEKGVDCA